MFDWVLTFGRDLALAVWLGGLIVIDPVETPARFRVKAISRKGGTCSGSLPKREHRRAPPFTDLLRRIGLPQ